MRWNLTAAVLAGAIGSKLMALETGGLVSDPPCVDCAKSDDQHSYNRAVAFGSVMLAQNGSNVSQWKEVRAYRVCVGTHPKSVALDDGSGTCVYRVMITTLYRFMECPDGRAFILRSGEGINVRKPTEGDSFGWSEDTTCSDSPVKNGDPLDHKRPLDMDHVTFAAR